jgi:hypothetical protein
MTPSFIELMAVFDVFAVTKKVGKKELGSSYHNSVQCHFLTCVTAQITQNLRLPISITQDKELSNLNFLH